MLCTRFEDEEEEDRSGDVVEGADVEEEEGKEESGSVIGEEEMFSRISIGIGGWSRRDSEIHASNHGSAVDRFAFKSKREQRDWVCMLEDRKVDLRRSSISS